MHTRSEQDRRSHFDRRHGQDRTGRDRRVAAESRFHDTTGFAPERREGLSRRNPGERRTNSRRSDPRRSLMDRRL